MKMIYGERVDANGRREQCVYLSYEEAAYADQEAREHGGKVSGGLLLGIALNRFRSNRCMYCGVGVGENHRACVIGEVQEVQS